MCGVRTLTVCLRPLAALVCVRMDALGMASVHL